MRHFSAIKATVRELLQRATTVFASVGGREIRLLSSVCQLMSMFDYSATLFYWACSGRGSKDN